MTHDELAVWIGIGSIFISIVSIVIALVSVKFAQKQPKQPPEPQKVIHVWLGEEHQHCTCAYSTECCYCQGKNHG